MVLGHELVGVSKVEGNRTQFVVRQEAVSAGAVVEHEEGRGGCKGNRPVSYRLDATSSRTLYGPLAKFATRRRHR